MRTLSALLVCFAASAPLAAQEEFKDFVEIANRIMRSGKIEEKETTHFAITAPGEGALLLGAHAERVYDLLKETLGVEPAEKIKISFLFLRQSEEQMGKGTFEKWEADTDTLYFQFDYDWRRDLGRGVVHAYLHKLAPDRASKIPPALLCGLKSYLGNFEGKTDFENFHVPMKGHVHVAKRAQSNASKGKLFTRKLADYKMADLADHEPAAWALASYLINSKGKREELAAWFKGHVEGKESPPPAAPEAEVTKWASALDVKLPDREEGRYLVADTMYYTIYVQKGTARIKPAMTDKQILEDLKKRMDLIYVKYAQGFNVEKFIMRRPKLYYYKDEFAYANMGGSRSALAHYMPLSKTLVAYENPDGKIVTTFHVLAHEGCHQFFDLAFPGFYESDDNPAWFSEGLAECFGSCEIRGGQFMIFTSTGSAAENQPAIREIIRQGKHTPFEELFSMSHQQFMVNAHIHYPQSWSICDFLWNAGYEEVIKRLIDGFKRGKPRDEVYAEAFVKDGRKLDLKSLEAQWLEYAKRKVK